MTERPDSLRSLMHSASSHHNRLVLPSFTALARPLTVQPDTNLHRWAPGTKLSAKQGSVVLA